MLTALAAVAPHLSDNTAPTPRDWTILLATGAILALVCWSTHHNQRRN